MLSAIILAAGESIRMGVPKALVQFDGKSFLETVISNYEDAGIENIFVILGCEATEIIENINLSSVQVVINEQYTLGQFSSFQAGVRKVGENSAGTFLSLVDQPQIGFKVIKEVKAAFETDPDNLIIPTFRGKRGHPPIFPELLFPGILSASPASTASSVIHNHVEKVCEIEVDDESILWNINTKDELAVVQKQYLFNN